LGSSPPSGAPDFGAPKSGAPGYDAPESGAELGKLSIIPITITITITISITNITTTITITTITLHSKLPRLFPGQNRFTQKNEHLPNFFLLLCRKSIDMGSCYVM